METKGRRMKIFETCKVKLCRRPAVLDYYGRPTCQRHWGYNCRTALQFTLKREYGIKEVDDGKHLPS